MRGARLLPLLLALLLAACLADSEPPADDEEVSEAAERLLAPHNEQEADPRTLRWALAPPSEIVPPLAADRSALVITDALFDGLTRMERGEPVPAAAEDWTSNGNGSVWTFRLRQGATFHDGSPVTAADVARSWEEGVRRGHIAPHLEDVVGHDALRAGEANALEGLHIRGQRTLHVFLERPRADFAAVVAHPTLAPLPEAWEDGEEALRAQPIGNGPFEVAEEWSGSAFVRARRNESWANGRAPAIDELLFRFTDASSGFVAFQQDRVDVAEVPGGGLDAALEQFGEADGATHQSGVIRAPAAQIYLLAMNAEEPPFDDPALRRALSFALDRERIADRVPDGNALPARGLAPAAIEGARVSSCTTCWHVPSTAARTFEDRGIEALELWVNEEGAHDAVADEIAGALAEVGVTLTVRSVPYAAFTDAIESGRAKLFRYGWSAEHPTLEDMVGPLLHSREPGLGTGNPGGYANPDVDRLLGQAYASTDPERRIELLQAAETLAVGREQAVIPVMFTRHRLVVGERVQGFRMGPTGQVDLARIRLRDTGE